VAEVYTLCMLSSCVYFVVIYEILYCTFTTKLIWRKTDQRDDNHADAYRLSFLPRDAMHKHGVCRHPVSVRPPVTF